MMHNGYNMTGAKILRDYVFCLQYFNKIFVLLLLFVRPEVPTLEKKIVCHVS